MTTTTTTHEVISRAEAKAKGLKRYFTGKPCVRGHVDDRNVSSGHCRECDRENANEYYAGHRDDRAKYHLANRDTILSKKALRRLIDKPKRLEYYRKNKERIALQTASYREENSEMIAKKKAEYYIQNKERISARIDRYRASNPWVGIKYSQKRRARKLSATPAWDADLTDFVMQEAADLAKRREAVTGFPWHVDHMLPLQAKAVCGLHTASNFQVIPASMNTAKGNRMRITEPGEWICQL